MKKTNQKKEKALRNEAYAKQFKRRAARGEDKKKRTGGKYGLWCRIAGHPPTCQCEYGVGTSSSVG